MRSPHFRVGGDLDRRRDARVQRAGVDRRTRHGAPVQLVAGDATRSSVAPSGVVRCGGWRRAADHGSGEAASRGYQARRRGSRDVMQGRRRRYRSGRGRRRRNARAGAGWAGEAALQAQSGFPDLQASQGTLLQRLLSLHGLSVPRWMDRIDSYSQGLIIRPVTGNRRPPVPVYRSGLAGYRSEPVKFKFEFKLPSATGSYRYTGRLHRYTGRFDRYTGRFGW